MKLEVGKTYLARDNNKTKITAYESGHPLPFIGDDNCGYRKDGGYMPLFGDRTAESEKSQFDLIQEIEPDQTP